MENERLNYQVFCRKIFPVFHTFVQFCIRFLHDHFKFSRLGLQYHLLMYCHTVFDVNVYTEKCNGIMLSYFDLVSKLVSDYVTHLTSIKTSICLQHDFLSTSRPWFVYLYNEWILWWKMSSDDYILSSCTIFYVVGAV